MRIAIAILLLLAAWLVSSCRTPHGGSSRGDYVSPAGGVSDAPPAPKSEQEATRDAFGTFHY